MPQLTWLACASVAGAAGIPQIAFMSAGTFDEPLFRARLERGERFRRQNKFEEWMFGGHRGLIFNF